MFVDVQKFIFVVSERDIKGLGIDLGFTGIYI